MPAEPPLSTTRRVADPRMASSLGHGLDVLEALCEAGTALSNTELSRRTGLSKATISRLTLALLSRGLLDDSAPQRGFRLGLGALSLGYPLLARWGLRQLARPAMLQLAQAWGASVSLGLRDRHRMIYVETVRGSDPAQFNPEVGAQLPMLATAMGRAWLAGARTDELQDLRLQLSRQQPFDPAQFEARRHEAVRQLQGQGFCISAGEWLSDVHALATPLNIEVLGQRLILNLGLPRSRCDAPSFPATPGADLGRLAQHIERCWNEQGAPRPAPFHAARRAAPKPRPRLRHPSAQTLSAGLDLLSLFEPGQWELGNREIADRLGVSPQTVVRLTHTLCERGFLQRSGQPVRYQLGWAALTPTQALLNDLRLRRDARVMLLNLSRRLGAAVSLGLEYRSSMIYVETVWQADERLRPPDIGAPMPLLRTAMGRAWLGQASPTQRVQALNRLRLHQPEEFSLYQDAAQQAVDFYQANGWCGSSDFQADITALATAVKAPHEGRTYVLNAGLLRSRPLTEPRLRALAEALCDTARSIEETLRH